MNELSEKITITDVVFMEASYEKKPVVSVSGRPFNSLTFRRSGSIRIDGANKDFVSAAGSLTLIPANMPYRTEVLESGEMFIMHFRTLERAAAFPMTAQPSYPLIFSNLFSNAVSRCACSGSWLAAKSFAYEILAELEAHLSVRNGGNMPAKIKYAKEYIDTNFCDPALRVALLAEMCGISEVHMRKLFKKYIGCSPIEYIKGCKMAFAENLLQTGLYSVTEAATRSGFDSISYFSSEFGKKHRMTPTEYMKRL